MDFDQRREPGDRRWIGGSVTVDPVTHTRIKVEERRNVQTTVVLKTGRAQTERRCRRRQVRLNRVTDRIEFALQKTLDEEPISRRVHPAEKRIHVR